MEHWAARRGDASGQTSLLGILWRSGRQGGLELGWPEGTCAESQGRGTRAQTSKEQCGEGGRVQIESRRHSHMMSEGHWRSYPAHLHRALSRGRGCVSAGSATAQLCFPRLGVGQDWAWASAPEMRSAGMLWREWTPSRLCGPSCDSWQRATCLRSAQHRVRAPCAGLLRHLLTLSCASQSTSPTAPRSAPHRKSDLALFRATGSHRAFFHRRLFSKLV
jgi:hypothetical protein